MIEAIQITDQEPSSINEIRDFLDLQYLDADLQSGIISFVVPGTGKEATLGDFIVKLPSGQIKVYNPREFHKIYAPIQKTTAEL